jgi:gas vesicle protein
MREVFRFLTFGAIFLACLVLGRYAWAKYLVGQKQTTLGQALEQTKNDLITAGEKINQQAERVLGAQTSGKQLNNYLREDLPKDVQKEFQQSEVVKEVQKEINTVINNATQSIKELPQSEVEKIKKDIKAEVCKDILK